MQSVSVDKLGSKLDQLSARVGRLSQQLATETAACRLSRWASRHPPKSDFLRQIAEGNTGRWAGVQLECAPVPCSCACCSSACFNF